MQCWNNESFAVTTSHITWTLFRFTLPQKEFLLQNFQAGIVSENMVSFHPTEDFSYFPLGKAT